MDEQYIERKSHEYLSNIVSLLKNIEENKFNKHFENILIQTIIINCVLTLEALANDILTSYPASNSLKKALDKLSVIDKYDFLLNIRIPSNKLDHGSLEIQKIKELIKIRNSYVHPKLVNKQLEDIDHKYKSFKPKYKNTQFLNISENSKLWTIQNAKESIKALLEFLNKFLIDLCKLSIKESSRYFSNEIVNNKNNIMISLEFIDNIKYLEKNININIKFIEI